MPRIRRDYFLVVAGVAAVMFSLFGEHLYTAMPIEAASSAKPPTDESLVKPTPAKPIFKPITEPTLAKPTPVKPTPVKPTPVKSTPVKSTPVKPEPISRLQVRAKAVISGPKSGTAGNLVEFDGSTSEGRWFLWFCMPPSEGFKPITERGGENCDIISTKALFADAKPGIYQVMLVVGGTESGDMAYHTYRNGTGPGPEPDPPTPEPDPPIPEPDPPIPEPDPPIPTTNLWGLIVEESSARTGEQALVLENTFVTDLFDGGFRIIDKDNKTNPSSKSWIDGAVESQLPYLYLSTASGVVLWEGPLPATVNKTVEIISKYKKFENKPKVLLPRAVLPKEILDFSGWKTVPVETYRIIESNPNCLPPNCCPQSPQPSIIYRSW